MRSPIDILIDDACGVDSTVQWITLRCPQCQRTKRVLRQEDDPSTEVVGECPDCVQEALSGR